MGFPLVKPGTPTTPYNSGGGAPQIPTPGSGNYNPSAGLYTTPGGGNAQTPNVGPGYQQGNTSGQYAATGPAGTPPPWMKNPTYNPVYGTWDDFATPQPFNQANEDARVGAENSYGANFMPPPAPYSQGGPGNSPTTPPGAGQNRPPPQIAPPGGPPAPDPNRPSPGGAPPAGGGPATPGLSNTPGAMNPLQQQLGFNDSQWQQLLQYLQGISLGPNYSTGGN